MWGGGRWGGGSSPMRSRNAFITITSHVQHNNTMTHTYPDVLYNCMMCHSKLTVPSSSDVNSHFVVQLLMPAHFHCNWVIVRNKATGQALIY